MDERRRRGGLLERLRDGSTPTRIWAALCIAATLFIAVLAPALVVLWQWFAADGAAPPRDALPWDALRLRLGFDAGAYPLTGEGLDAYVRALQVGAETRWFLTARTPMELLLALAYGPALVMLILSPLRAQATRRKLAPPSPLIALALVPLVAAAADLIETVALVWLVVESRPGADLLDQTAAQMMLIATPLKFAALAASLVMAVVTRLAPSAFFASSARGALGRA